MKDEDQCPDFNCTFENFSSLCMHKKFRDGLEDIYKYGGEIEVQEFPSRVTWLDAIKNLLDS